MSANPLAKTRPQSFSQPAQRRCPLPDNPTSASIPVDITLAFLRLFTLRSKQHPSQFPQPEPRMPRSTPRSAPMKPEARTRVGNGSAVLAGVDGRSIVSRRYREILEALVSDMGGDPSEAQAQIARRAASLAIWCEQQDADAANGSTIDVAKYTTASNTLRRLLESLGLKRTARNITPTLSEYAARKAAERAAA